MYKSEWAVAVQILIDRKRISVAGSTLKILDAKNTLKDAINVLPLISQQKRPYFNFLGVRERCAGEGEIFVNKQYSMKMNVLLKKEKFSNGENEFLEFCPVSRGLLHHVSKNIPKIYELFSPDAFLETEEILEEVLRVLHIEWKEE